MTAFSVFRSVTFLLFALVSVMQSSPLKAENASTETISSIYFTTGKDSIDNYDIAIGTNLELENNHGVELGYSQNENSDSDDYLKQAFIGLNTNPYEPLSIGFRLIQTEQKNNIAGQTILLETLKLNSPVLFNISNWQFGMTPSINTIVLDLPGDNQMNLHQQGGSLELSYFGLENYLFSVSYTQYQLSEIPLKSLIAQLSPFVKAVLAYTVQTSTSSLEAKNLTLLVARQFNWGLISYSYTKSESVEILNESFRNTIHFINASYSISNSWSLDTSFTHQDDPNDDFLQSLSMGFTYYW